MPYFPFAPSTDNRSARGLTPLTLQNCLIEKNPDAAATRSPYVIAPTPGRVRRATLGGNVRGLFSEPGCRDGMLFAPAGGALYQVTDSYAAADVGTVSGGSVVKMRAFRQNLAMLASSMLKVWDGSSLANVTDADAPSSPSTLAVVGSRLLAADSANDTFNWSKAGDPFDWDSAGVAADIYLSDPIVAQEEVGGYLASFNSRSTQFWAPTGGSEAEAFAPLTGTQRRGIAGRDLFARTSAGGIIIGDDRVAYGVSGTALVPIPNRDMEEALRSLTPAQIEAGQAWSYKDGSKEFCGLKTALERGFVYDLESKTWHQRTRYGQNSYDVSFVTQAFNEVLCASASSPYIWAFDPDTYTDDGDPIERVFTVKVPVARGTPVNRLVWNIRCFAQPLTGQGAAPAMMVDYSADDGKTWASDEGAERTIDLPARGDFSMRVQDFQFGRAETEYGFLLKCRISDPIGFAVQGVWVNPSAEEMA